MKVYIHPYAVTGKHPARLGSRSTVTTRFLPFALRYDPGRTVQRWSWAFAAINR
jgi:hypothetical protein